MNNFKIFLIKFIIFVGSKTFLGRGQIRKLLVVLIESIQSSIKFNKSKPLFKINFYDFQIYYYGDSQTGTKLYFQRNESKEIKYLKKNFEPNSWFIDVGANVGLYTLNISNLNNHNFNVKTLSIEPSPTTFFRLKENLKLLIKRNKHVKNKTYLENIAVGNIKSSGFIDNKTDYANVKVLDRPNKKKNLLTKIKINRIINIIKKYKIHKIYCMKIDTEGFEHVILKDFFKQNNYTYYPKVLIIEHNNNAGFKKINKLITKEGYKILFTTNSNTIYKQL